MNRYIPQTKQLTTPHRVGVLLLLIASILLLVTTISAPVIRDISILKVTLTNKTEIRNSSVVFGTVSPSNPSDSKPFPQSKSLTNSNN